MCRNEKNPTPFIYFTFNVARRKYVLVSVVLAEFGK